jgi:hypothetical protein
MSALVRLRGRSFYHFPGTRRWPDLGDLSGDIAVTTKQLDQLTRSGELDALRFEDPRDFFIAAAQKAKKNMLGLSDVAMQSHCLASALGDRSLRAVAQTTHAR